MYVNSSLLALEWAIMHGNRLLQLCRYSKDMVGTAGGENGLVFQHGKSFWRPFPCRVPYRVHVVVILVMPDYGSLTTVVTGIKGDVQSWNLLYKVVLEVDFFALVACFISLLHVQMVEVRRSRIVNVQKAARRRFLYLVSTMRSLLESLVVFEYDHTS